MTERNRQTVTGDEERQEVQKYLRNEGGPWVSMPPDYTTFDRSAQLRKIDDVARAVEYVICPDADELDSAYYKSWRFVNSAFDFYSGRREIGRAVARAFVVPMRSDRDNEIHSSESTPFYPLLDPNKFGVNSEIRMRTMYGLPPTILDTYLKSPRDNETGVLVLSPLHSDMARDIVTNPNDLKQKITLMEVAGRILEQTVQFAHHRLGAKTIGLGATLPRPGITDYGNVLRAFRGMESLVTTTGHGGTVYMILETVREVMRAESIDSSGPIGIIGGAGSIGWSSTVAAHEIIGDHDIVSFDKNLESLRGKIAGYKSEKSVNTDISVASSAVDVLKRTNVIISAITGRINLDAVDPYGNLDLSGKVIIDDSQPGCFDREQVEARGGKLVWVVVEDGSENGFMTKDGMHTGGVGYDYGKSSGLVGQASEFACSWEAGVIAKHLAYEKAINAPVEPDNVLEIGELFKQSGARVAPYQSVGRRVHID